MKGIIIVLLMSQLSLSAQTIYTKEGQVKFTSEAPMETIEAENNKALSVIDLASGQIEWAVLINAFQFDKKLMQEHFNENYMESTKYPKAFFKGTLSEPDRLSGITGSITLDIEGVLTIKGVSHQVNTTAIFELIDDALVAKSDISVSCADYDIEIPKVVRENIANTVDIQLVAHYQNLDQ